MIIILLSNPMEIASISTLNIIKNIFTYTCLWKEIFQVHKKINEIISRT